MQIKAGTFFSFLVLFLSPGFLLLLSSDWSLCGLGPPKACPLAKEESLLLRPEVWGGLWLHNGGGTSEALVLQLSSQKASPFPEDNTKQSFFLFLEPVLKLKALHTGWQLWKNTSVGVSRKRLPGKS